MKIREIKRSNRDKINECKRALRDSDYKAIKYAEGELTMSEYAPIREERRALRAQIRALETEINALKG